MVKYKEFKQKHQDWSIFEFDVYKSYQENLIRWETYYLQNLQNGTYEAYIDLVLYNSMSILETHENSKIKTWLLNFQTYIFPDYFLPLLEFKDPNKHLNDILNVIARLYLNEFNKPLDIMIDNELPGIQQNYPAFIGAPYLQAPITEGMHYIYKYNTLQALKHASMLNTHNQIKQFEWSDYKLKAKHHASTKIDIRQRLIDYYGIEEISHLITEPEYIRMLFEKAKNSLYTWSQSAGKTSAPNYYVFFLSRLQGLLELPDNNLLSTYIFFKFIESENKPLKLKMSLFNFNDDTEMTLNSIKDIEAFNDVYEQLKTKCKSLIHYPIIELITQDANAETCLESIKTIQDLSILPPVQSCIMPEF